MQNIQPLQATQICIQPENKQTNQTTNSAHIMKTNSYRSLHGAALAGAVLLTASIASAQNLFVADFSTDDIYEYTPGGVQSTFATGMNFPSAVAFNNAGDLFVGNSADNGPAGSITEITPGGTQSTFATGVDPSDLASYNGNLFVADYNSGNIYEYTPNGARSTFAGGFSFPLSLAFNSVGDLFVGAGYGNNNGTITEITPGGTESPFASGLSFP
jgi:hypothetical protein